MGLVWFLFSIPLHLFPRFWPQMARLGFFLRFLHFFLPSYTAALFQPMLHETGTFEGCSANWAIAPRQKDKFVGSRGKARAWMKTSDRTEHCFNFDAVFGSDDSFRKLLLQQRLHLLSGEVEEWTDAGDSPSSINQVWNEKEWWKENSRT